MWNLHKNSYFGQFLSYRQVMHQFGKRWLQGSFEIIGIKFLKPILHIYLDAPSDQFYH